MKYYCKNCGCQITADEFPDGLGDCPSCGEFSWHKLSDYETVGQWEERKGQKYPNTAPVYCRYRGMLNGWWLCTYKNATNGLRKLSDIYIIVATEEGAPPDDRRPE